MTCCGSCSLLSLHETNPVARRAISRSKRRSRQIWVVWIGRRIAFRNAYRLGRGTLIARIIGDEIFVSDSLQAA
jgi:hypothetical protein